MSDLPVSIEGAVVAAHVLARFRCDRCRAWCERLTRANVFCGRIVEPAERPPGEIVCNGCQNKEQAATAEEIVKRKRAKAWAKKISAAGLRKG